MGKGVTVEFFQGHRFSKTGLSDLMSVTRCGRLKTWLLLLLIVIALVACMASPEKVGCEKFTTLVEEVKVAGEARAGRKDYTTAEIESAKNEVNEIAELIGRESTLPLDPLAVVVRLELIARLYFDLTDPQKGMSWSAYELWASAKGMYDSESEYNLNFQYDGNLAATDLAQACENEGHASPLGDTDVILDFVDRNCPPHPNCYGCFCDELP